METVIAIAADNNAYLEMVVPFVASLRDNAKFKGPICVIDYGISQPRKRRLEAVGCTLMPPLKKHYICLDKVATVAEYGDDVCYCLYDADIWFAGPIDGLFSLSQARLVATFDAWVCTFLYDCLLPKSVPVFRELMHRHLTKYRWAMQSGMVKATRDGFRELAAMQSRVLKSGFANDDYGADTVALHILYDEKPDFTDVCDIAVNCVPKWQGFRRLSPTEWRVEDHPIAAIHYTGDYRANLDHKNFSSAYNFPERHAYWLGLLEGT